MRHMHAVRRGPPRGVLAVFSMSAVVLSLAMLSEGAAILRIICALGSRHTLCRHSAAPEPVDTRSSTATTL